MNYIRKWAQVSDCGLYRYVLGRQWSTDTSAPNMHFCMLNPSTADGEQDDPTIRRCVAYAMREDCSGLVVTNLSAFRSAYPRDLIAWLRKNSGLMGSFTQAGSDAAWGPNNDQHIRDCTLASKFNLVAWGINARHKLLHQRAKRVLAQLLSNAPDGVTALQVSEDGIPNHPLMLPGSLRPQPLSLLTAGACA